MTEVEKIWDEWERETTDLNRQFRGCVVVWMVTLAGLVVVGALARWGVIG
jgi:hypothetical protein